MPSHVVRVAVLWFASAIFLCRCAALPIVFQTVTGDSVNLDFTVSADGSYAATVSTVDSTLTVMSLTTGAKVFRGSVSGCKFSSAYVALASSTTGATIPLVAIVSCGDSTIRGIDAVRGTALWFKSAASIIASPVAVIRNYLAYGGSLFPVVTLSSSSDAFASSPTSMWSSTAGSRFAAAPLLVGNSQLSDVIAGDLSGALRCFAAANGTQRWSAAIAGQVTFTPVVAKRPFQTSVVVVASLGGSVQAFDIATGNPVWSVASQTASAPPIVVPLPDGHEVVVCSRSDGVVSAINVSSGRVQWQLTLTAATPIAGAAVVFTADPLVDDVRLVASLSNANVKNATLEPILCIADQTGAVFAATAVTGRLLARDALGTSISGAPRVASAGASPLLVLLSGTSIVAVNLTAWVSTFADLNSPGNSGSGSDGGIDGAARVVAIVIPVTVVLLIIAAAVAAKVLRAKPPIVEGGDVGATAAPAPQNLELPLRRRREPEERGDAHAPRAAVRDPPERDPVAEVLFVPAAERGSVPEITNVRLAIPPEPANLDTEDPNFAQFVASLDLNEPFAPRPLSWRWVSWISSDFTVPSHLPQLPLWISAFDGFIVRCGKLHLLTILKVGLSDQAAFRRSAVFRSLELHIFATANRSDDTEMALVVRGRGTPFTPDVAAMILNHAGEEALVAAARPRVDSDSRTDLETMLRDTAILVLGRGSRVVSPSFATPLIDSAASNTMGLKQRMLDYATRGFALPRWDPAQGLQCSVCFGPIAVDTSTEADTWRVACTCCSGEHSTQPHLACAQCVNNRLNALFDSDSIDPDRVPCPMTTHCGGQWRLEDFVMCLDARTLRRWHAQTVEATSQKVFAGLQRAQVSSPLRRHCEEVRLLLRPRCPHCGLAFESFAGCALVRCGVLFAKATSEHRGCGNSFCGACLVPAPCPAGHGHAFLSAVELRACWNRWRVQRVVEYKTRMKLNGTALWTEVVNAMQADLGALGIAAQSVG